MKRAKKKELLSYQLHLKSWLITIQASTLTLTVSKHTYVLHASLQVLSPSFCVTDLVSSTDRICRQVEPHDDGDTETLMYKTNTADRRGNLTTCSFFNQSCCVHRGIIPRNGPGREKYEYSFIVNHDPTDCANTLEELRRARRLSKLVRKVR